VSVGLLLVSHSARLAEGLRELVSQLAQGQVPVGVAAGGPDGVLGTSALDIAEGASALLGTADGVVVLVDLGSAVLSAGAALEQLAPEQRERVRLADAPFVEGAVAAGVEASLGADLAAVLAAAEAARHLDKLA
jgi:dihydroxyacetone kinase phosphotransfer subunit